MEIKSNKIFKKDVDLITIATFAENNKITTQAVDYAISTNAIDYVVIDGKKFILLNEKTRNYSPRGNSYRNTEKQDNYSSVMSL
jgi:hypothetical protein